VDVKLYGLSAGVAIKRRAGHDDRVLQKVADHYLAWRKTYAIWGDGQELKITYQK
jgi:hypothetical protein